MADNRNALAPIAAEQFARALEKAGAAGRPAEPTAPQHASWAQRAEEILEQGRPRPPAETDPEVVGYNQPQMLASINSRVEAILDLAHDRSHGARQEYEASQTELRELIEAKCILEGYARDRANAPRTSELAAARAATQADEDDTEA